jgi:hypothetical protein
VAGLRRGPDFAPLYRYRLRQMLARPMLAFLLVLASLEPAQD